MDAQSFSLRHPLSTFDPPLDRYIAYLGHMSTSLGGVVLDFWLVGTCGHMWAHVGTLFWRVVRQSYDHGWMSKSLRHSADDFKAFFCAMVDLRSTFQTCPGRVWDARCALWRVNSEPRGTKNQKILRVPPVHSHSTIQHPILQWCRTFE